MLIKCIQYDRSNVKRRQFASGAGAVLGAFALGGYMQESWGEGVQSSLTDSYRLTERLRVLEAESGGRLGVALFDTHTGRGHSHRGDERFPMCSTFKMLAVALVLSRVDAGKEQLDRRIRFSAADLVAYSPVTESRAGTSGITVAELCEAAITISDNTAANLLLQSFGGPAQLTAYLRSIDDRITRLDRIEPELNEAAPGDPRDTTTPNAMLSTMRGMVLGTALSVASRRQLKHWLVANKTSDNKLRALLPADWRVADKTGSGGYGSNNDVGILWPPGRSPILVTCYLTETKAPLAVRDAMSAQAGRLAASLADSN
jgi:beta-lactamase class A